MMLARGALQDMQHAKQIQMSAHQSFEAVEAQMRHLERARLSADFCLRPWPPHHPAGSPALMAWTKRLSGHGKAEGSSDTAHLWLLLVCPHVVSL